MNDSASTRFDKYVRCLGPYIDESMVLAFEVDDILKVLVASADHPW